MTDGEFRRKWWHFDFLSVFVGVELYQSEVRFEFKGVQRKADGIKVTEQIKSRIAEATAYVPVKQPCLSPQCGFASTEEGNLLTEEQQSQKVRHVVAIAQDVWD